jgi:hypothetical protein
MWTCNASNLARRTGTTTMKITTDEALEQRRAELAAEIEAARVDLILALAALGRTATGESRAMQTARGRAPMMALLAAEAKRACEVAGLIDRKTRWLATLKKQPRTHHGRAIEAVPAPRPGLWKAAVDGAVIHGVYGSANGALDAAKRAVWCGEARMAKASAI